MIEEIKNEAEVEVSSQSDLQGLIKENLQLTKEIYALTKKINRFIAFQKFMSFVYFLLIVVPIIISVLYLPPLLKQLFGQYQEILGAPGGGGQTVEELLKAGSPAGVKSLPPEIFKILEK